MPQISRRCDRLSARPQYLRALFPGVVADYLRRVRRDDRAVTGVGDLQPQVRELLLRFEYLLEVLARHEERHPGPPEKVGHQVADKGAPALSVHETYATGGVARQRDYLQPQLIDDLAAGHPAVNR